MLPCCPHACVWSQLLHKMLMQRWAGSRQERKTMARQRAERLVDIVFLCQSRNHRDVKEGAVFFFQPVFYWLILYKFSRELFPITVILETVDLNDYCTAKSFTSAQTSFNLWQTFVVALPLTFYCLHPEMTSCSWPQWWWWDHSFGWNFIRCSSFCPTLWFYCENPGWKLWFMSCLTLLSDLCLLAHPTHKIQAVSRPISFSTLSMQSICLSVAIFINVVVYGWVLTGVSLLGLVLLQVVLSMRTDLHGVGLRHWQWLLLSNRTASCGANTKLIEAGEQRQQKKC